MSNMGINSTKINYIIGWGIKKGETGGNEDRWKKKGKNTNMFNEFTKIRKYSFFISILGQNWIHNTDQRVFFFKCP
mgnify:CR=1 FL=1